MANPLAQALRKRSLLARQTNKFASGTAMNLGMMAGSAPSRKSTGDMANPSAIAQAMKLKKGKP